MIGMFVFPIVFISKIQDVKCTEETTAYLTRGDDVLIDAELGIYDHIDTIIYAVNGEKITQKVDLPEEQSHSLYGRSFKVKYDPKNPKRFVICD